jgi:hypothetical protein
LNWTQESRESAEKAYDSFASEYKRRIQSEIAELKNAQGRLDVELASRQEPKP